MTKSYCIVLMEAFGEGYVIYYNDNYFKRRVRNIMRTHTGDIFIYYENGDICRLLDVNIEDFDIYKPIDFNQLKSHINLGKFI